MKTRVLGALVLTAFFAALPATVDADRYGERDKEEKKKGLKVIECPPECGFKVRSHVSEEIIEIVQTHAKEHHDLELTDEQVKALIQDVRKAKKDKEKKERKEREERQ